MTNEEKAIREAFIAGLKSGITRYAWWKDGKQEVGTCGHTLKQALEKVDREFENAEVL